MFIIVPKRRKRGSVTGDGSTSNATAIESGQESCNGTAQADTTERPTVSNRNENGPGSDRGPVRSTTACDACRMRKTKCNGNEPCSRCRQRQIICVYSRPTGRDLPASASQVALLRHQQRRLYTAVQQMACEIARLQGHSSRSPETFSVPELLSQYAPDHSVRDSPAEELSPTHTGSNKRAASPTSVATKRSRLGASGSSNDVLQAPIISSDESWSGGPAFELRPAPATANASIDQLSDPYQAMVQFLQSMNGAGMNSTGNMVIPSSTAESSQSAGAWAPSAGDLPQQNSTQLSTQQLMDLIDWDASMQFFQNPSDSSPDASLPTDAGGIGNDFSAFGV